MVPLGCYFSGVHGEFWGFVGGEEVIFDCHSDLESWEMYLLVMQEMNPQKG